MIETTTSISMRVKALSLDLTGGKENDDLRFIVRGDGI